MKILKVGGFLVAGFGLLVLESKEVVLGIILTLIGAGTVIFCQFSGDISRKRARKELMELKSLLDNGVLDENEYEVKSRALKDKI